MSQLEIIRFLERNSKNFFCAEQIHFGLGRKGDYRKDRSLYRNLKALRKRSEVEMCLVPNDKSGRGSNWITLYKVKLEE